MSEDEIWEKHIQFTEQYPPEESTYFVDFIECSLNFKTWLEKQNPDYLDLLVAKLSQNEIPIKGVLLSEVGKLAASRLIRESFAKNHMRTTANKSFRREYDYCSFRLILQLITWCDLTLSKSCELVTQWRDKQDMNLSSQKKASSLEKEFSIWRKLHQDLEEQVRNPSKFAFVHNYRNWNDDQRKRAINSLLGDEFGDAPDHLKGYRR
jgi:hypothetical protein